jgi:AcrR family transcriptional regulator
MSSSATKPAARRRFPKSVRRAKLLEAAEAVFAEHGYEGATMELIAARGEVTRPLLYEHFSSLDEVYVECVRAARADLDARFLEAGVLAEGELRDQLRLGVATYFEFVRDHGDGWEVLFGGGSAPSGIGRLTVELRFRTVEQIAALFKNAIPEGDMREALIYAHALSGAGEQLARWWRQNPDVELEELVDRMMDLWDGLGAVVERIRG